MDFVFRLKWYIDNNFLFFCCVVRVEISEYKGLDPINRLKFLKALCELRVQVISSFHLAIEVYYQCMPPSLHI